LVQKLLQNLLQKVKSNVYIHDIRIIEHQLSTKLICHKTPGSIDNKTNWNSKKCNHIDEGKYGVSED